MWSVQLKILWVTFIEKYKIWFHQRNVCAFCDVLLGDLLKHELLRYSTVSIYDIMFIDYRCYTSSRDSKSSFDNLLWKTRSLSLLKVISTMYLRIIVKPEIPRAVWTPRSPISAVFIHFVWSRRDIENVICLYFFWLCRKIASGL